MRSGLLHRVAPLRVGIDALERGIEHRSRVIVAPPWVRYVLPFPGVAQRVVERVMRGDVEEALAIARGEDAPLTTEVDESNG